jgi:hypothetical protein
MSWDSPSRLRLTFKRVPNLNLQVCKYGEIVIAVDTMP